MAPRGKDYLRRQSTRAQEERLKELYESTSYRLNGQICPYCRAANGKAVRLRLNPDDWFECPECRLVAQLLYEPSAVNAINLLAWSGTGDVKGERAFDHLFEDLLVIYKHSNGTIVALDSDEEVIELKKTIDAGSDEKQ